MNSFRTGYIVSRPADDFGPASISNPQYHRTAAETERYAALEVALGNTVQIFSR